MAKRFAAWMVLSLAALTGCAYDRTEHPTQTCQRTDECGNGQECFRGFCIALEGGGSGGTGGSGGAGGGGDCVGSITEACYDGAPGTEDKGECRGGERLCVNGQWSQCLGQVIDVVEQCNGRDDDCDEAIDEIDDANCDTSMLGECAVGRYRCVGALAVCQQTNLRVEEVCDTRDNDCDGAIDEQTSGICYPANEGCHPVGAAYQCDGVCEVGTRECGGNANDCNGAVVPSTEACAAGEDLPLDEDCDGEVDEQCACTSNVPRACYGGPPGTQGVGACVEGSQTCTTTWGDCIGDRGPSPETCVNPGVDDDCNGVVDDVAGAGAFCVDEEMLGDCRVGTRRCQGSTLRCITPDAATEVCDGSQHDEDCDGNVDEGFDLNADENNCGSCGNACGSSQTCCAGQCVNLNSDPNACGDCDTRCGGGSCCAGDCANTTNDRLNCGGCGVSCAGEQTCCGNCTNTAVDANNCGGCGVTCESDQFCCEGSCQDTSCSCADCEDAGGSCCDETCTDPETDELNCGGCGVTCSTGQTCLGGVCCGPGQINCNDTCVTATSDENHCGGCGNSCGSSQECCGGSCIDPNSSAGNCGGCGQVCQSPSSCSAGLCCGSGTSNCGQTCVDLMNSAQHCGGCGMPCGVGETCCSGQCRDLANDHQSCGSCTNGCGLTEECCQGECRRVSSAGNDVSCDCEEDCGADTCCGKSCVDLMNDSNNCGGCGIVCGSSGGPIRRFCCNGQCTTGLCIVPL